MEIEQALQKFGLEGREARVYFATLKLRQARVTEIAEASSYERTYCYLILKDLEKKGLVNKFEPKGKIATYSAEPPQRLVDDAKTKLSELKKIVPSMNIYLSDSINLPKIQSFQGVEGIRKIYQELIFSKEKEGLGIINPDSAYGVLGESFNRQLKKEIEKGVKIQDLVVDGKSAEMYIATKLKFGGPKSKLLPKGIKFETDFLIYGDKVSMISFEDPIHAYLITSVSIANAWRQLHKVLWNL